jgi:hypothetical protein
MTKVLDINGSIRTVIYTEPDVCANATIENSNASYTDSVASGGTLVLPDITVTDSDGSTYTQPSVEDVVCTLSLAVGDVLTIDFDAAGAGGVVILTGTYA